MMIQSKMCKSRILAVILFFFNQPLWARPPLEDSETVEASSSATNPAFRSAHLLPTAETIPGGSYVVGTVSAVGVTDDLMLSTDVVRDVLGYYNLGLKVPFVRFPTFRFAGFVQYETFNLDTADSRNPSSRIRAWKPGIVTAYELSSNTAFFLGGNFFISNRKIPHIETSGFLHGARAEADWSWAYSENSLALGATYDFTFKLYGMGFSHHWPTFLAGIHYVFNADKERLIPMFQINLGYSF